MPAIPTIKIVDKEVVGLGYRIINVEDKQPGDVEFVEGAVENEEPVKPLRRSKKESVGDGS